MGDGAAGLELGFALLKRSQPGVQVLADWIDLSQPPVLQLLLLGIVALVGRLGDERRQAVGLVEIPDLDRLQLPLIQPQVLELQRRQALAAASLADGERYC